MPSEEAAIWLKEYLYPTEFKELQDFD
jgi:hypothetical protein